MKAAVLFPQQEAPQYVDFPEPLAHKEAELVISVKAAAIKQIDKVLASGKHYSNNSEILQPRIIGGDGVGLLEDGRRVYALGLSGMAAEKALIDKNRMIPLPEGLSDMTAAALPNAVAGSAMALLFRAGMKAGETVLINGATGFTGKIAVQIAKYYGAKKVIVTGRNEESLRSLLALGADETISLKMEDEKFIKQIKDLHHYAPIDIVLDYLWGHPAELILNSLKGDGSWTHKTRFVSIGSMAGDPIQLSSAILRSVDLQLSGSGLGSWTKEEIKKLFSEIIPEMFQLAADNNLLVETINLPLKDIGTWWDLPASAGKRMVVTL